MMSDFSKQLAGAKKLLQSTNIDPKNKDYVLRFIEQLSAEGIKKVRQLKYLYTLKTIAVMLKKDFFLCNKQDITKLLSEINNSDYKEWTKRDFKVVIKRFFKWLREQEGKSFARGEYPDEVKWVSTGKKKDRQKLPSQLFTIEDVNKMANKANNLRDKCFVLVLYETGARIGELMNIKLKDIEFDKYGAKITLFGKTGARKIRIIASAPAISNWLLDHPDRENNDSSLFCGIWSKKRGEDIDYQTFRTLLLELKEKTGIKKPVNPHHFRHSRVTELAKSFTEAQLCEYFGWKQGSKEAATYVHLSGRDMDEATLELYGIKDEEEKQESKFKPITCPRCNTVNSPDSKFCSSCSMGLDLKVVMDFEKNKEDATSLLVSIYRDEKKKEKFLAALLAITKGEEI